MQSTAFDKAKVENGVLLAERWILACLRNHTFFSLAELNHAIGILLDRLNSRPFKKLQGSRRSLFQSLEHPALKPLPREPYVYADWKKARVHIDYHVEVDGHYYSVPYYYVRQEIDVRLTKTTVECFIKGKRIASHMRSRLKGRHTTVKEHMPPSHRFYADWTPDRFIKWASKTGPATAELVAKIMESRDHPLLGYRSCMGILHMGKSYGAERLEAASRRALAIGATSCSSMKSILKKGLDRCPLFDKTDNEPPIQHKNIRGAGYFASCHCQDEPAPTLFNQN